jgi:nucleoid-associated protein YgaU
MDMDNKEIKCPICGKPGIPDYHLEDVICPQCESDLKIFHELYNVKEQIAHATAPSQKKWKVYALALGLIGLIALGANFIPRNNQVPVNDLSQELSSLRTQKDSLAALVELLNDSIISINSSNSFNRSKNELQSGTYEVKLGDSFWKISQRLYGSGHRFAEIAKLNKMDLDETIRVGDVLKVNPK